MKMFQGMTALFNGFEIFFQILPTDKTNSRSRILYLLGSRDIKNIDRDTPILASLINRKIHPTHSTGG
jgi:hypothetical protein